MKQQLVRTVFLALLLSTSLQNPAFSQSLYFGWAHGFGAGTSDEGVDITTNNNGDVFVTGEFWGKIDFNPQSGSLDTAFITSTDGFPDVFIQKLSAQGNFLWAGSLRSMDNGSVYVDAIEADSSGYVYVTGLFRGKVDFDPRKGTADTTFIQSSGSANAFLLKLNPNGNLVWIKTLRGTTSSHTSRGTSLDIDDFGNIYLGGVFKGTVDFDPAPGSANSTLLTANNNDAFIEKLDSGGNFKWAKRIGGSESDWLWFLEIDNSGQIYAGGSFRQQVDLDPGTSPTDTFIVQSRGSGDAWVSRLDTAGQFLWGHSVGGPSTDTYKSLALDPLGNLYLSGTFADSMDMDSGNSPGDTLYLRGSGVSETFVEKLSFSGSLIWAKSFGGRWGDICSGSVLDSRGLLFTVGRFHGQADFDPGPGSASFTPTNGDIFMQVMDTSGAYVWARPFGGSLEDQASAIHVDENDNIYTTGYFRGLVSFNIGSGASGVLTSHNSTSSSNPSADIYIQKLTRLPDTNNTSIQSFNSNSIRIYPNPNKGVFTIDLSRVPNCDIVIMDINGREVFQRSNVHTPFLKVEANVPAGVYVLRASSGVKEYQQKFVIY